MTQGFTIFWCALPFLPMVLVLLLQLLPQHANRTNSSKLSQNDNIKQRPSTARFRVAEQVLREDRRFLIAKVGLTGNRSALPG
jgi:hypothetical protein